MIHKEAGYFLHLLLSGSGAAGHKRHDEAPMDAQYRRRYRLVG
jgi:hypothetical protein